jgi:hypothetical protein
MKAGRWQPLWHGEPVQALTAKIPRTCSAVRDYLLATGGEPASEFLDDFSKNKLGRPTHG